MVFVGTANAMAHPKQPTNHIYVYELMEDGRLEERSRADAPSSPGFLCYEPRRRVVYSVHSASTVPDSKPAEPSGFVSAYLFDPKTWQLRLLNTQSCCGLGPAHVSVSEDGRYVLVANYGAVSSSPWPSFSPSPCRSL